MQRAMNIIAVTPDSVTIHAQSALSCCALSVVLVFAVIVVLLATGYIVVVLFGRKRSLFNRGYKTSFFFLNFYDLSILIK